MEKILDAQVRKILFATMKENGFTQVEITEIIGNKFKGELEKMLKEAVLTLDKGFNEDNYELMQLTVSDDNEWSIKNIITELIKLRKQLGINACKKEAAKENANPASENTVDNSTEESNSPTE